MLLELLKCRGSSSQLLFCHTKPHGAASKDTIKSRWLKQVMFDAGVDTSIVKPHSTRSEVLLLLLPN